MFLSNDYKEIRLNLRKVAEWTFFETWSYFWWTALFSVVSHCGKSLPHTYYSCQYPIKITDLKKCVSNYSQIDMILRTLLILLKEDIFCLNAEWCDEMRFLIIINFTLNEVGLVGWTSTEHSFIYWFWEIYAINCV